MRRSLWIVLAAGAILGSGVFGAINAVQSTRLRIVNGLGNWTIRYVYISPTSSDSWGPDRLGSSEVLRPGESQTWTLDPGSYDLRAKDEDEDTYTRRRVCIPERMTTEWTVELSDRDTNR
ncbi:MAG: hypothetical protein BWY06_02011 [Candidatus Latescibacteria bacterium ADurb.Bin168]|nr:MAG: hypothetical protein BWY06_02011 [Candidatus Latescibacteria bacterium ADurb.Bin168]